MQALWKLLPSKNPGEGEKITATVEEILAEELASKRVIIASWLMADPTAILQSGHIIATVHHGGANSFFEGCYVGIPQIVLAQWYDTYDYAARVVSNIPKQNCQYGMREHDIF